MEVTISIPDKFVPPTNSDADLSRQMLEAYAIESYRNEFLSLGQIAELLGLSVDQANAFLKEHQVPLNTSLEDLEEDLETAELLLSK